MWRRTGQATGRTLVTCAKLKTVSNVKKFLMITHISDQDRTLNLVVVKKRVFKALKNEYIFREKIIIIREKE